MFGARPFRMRGGIDHPARIGAQGKAVQILAQTFDRLHLAPDEDNRGLRIGVHQIANLHDLFRFGLLQSGPGARRVAGAHRPRRASLQGNG